jgi:translation initiation factor IF-2
MAIKLTDLADKLKITKLQLKRELKSLDIRGLDPKKSFFEKDIAEKIIEQLKPEKKEKSKKIEDKKDENKKDEKQIEIPEVISVKNFAGKLNLPVTDVIKELLKNGVAATINEKIDFDTATIIASDFGFEAVKEETSEEEIESSWDESKLKPRPPVVTILGHVDHGKTTLLDRIRKEHVADSESGGITQHIGAYQVEIEVEDKRRKITFIDTPGHKAFTTMRAQGAKVTDIAILIVAADDSVQPQTKEALDHIKDAGVPVVVAINKIDLPNANVEKTKQDLVEIGLTPEDLGGTTPVVEVSAEKGTNVEDLLEIIVLTADLQDLKAPYDSVTAKGVVIESHKHKGAGVLATVLIKQGILNQGDAIVAGTISGVARIMENDFRQRIDQAKPSQPVRIVGFEDIPPVGAIVEQVSDIKQARKLAKENKEKLRKEGRTSGTGLIEASKSIRKGESKEVKIILKADVAGSLEALKQSLEALGNDQVQVNIIKAGVGPVNESDIEMATASNAVIISFRMPVDKAAQTLARQNNIEISSYEIIYKLIEDLNSALEGILAPKIVREELGKAKILKVFYSSGNRCIIGCRVTSGGADKQAKADIIRNDKKIGQAEIDSLRIEEKEVDEIKRGQQCGIGLRIEEKVKEGDVIEFYKEKKVTQKLST